MNLWQFREHLLKSLTNFIESPNVMCNIGIVDVDSHIICIGVNYIARSINLCICNLYISSVTRFDSNEEIRAFRIKLLFDIERNIINPGVIMCMDDAIKFVMYVMTYIQCAVD